MLNITTHHYDNARTGWNSNETQLTPQVLQGSGLRLLFQRVVDDIVFAQPLYVAGLSINGVVRRNVVFIATEAGSIYAFDADQPGTQLWITSLVGPGEVRAGGANWPGVITATPVIDISTDVMYVLGYLQDNELFFRLFANDITAGTILKST